MPFTENAIQAADKPKHPSPSTCKSAMFSTSDLRSLARTAAAGLFARGLQMAAASPSSDSPSTGGNPLNTAVIYFLIGSLAIACCCGFLRTMWCSSNGCQRNPCCEP